MLTNCKAQSPTPQIGHQVKPDMKTFLFNEAEMDAKQM